MAPYFVLPIVLRGEPKDKDVSFTTENKISVTLDVLIYIKGINVTNDPSSSSSEPFRGPFSDSGAPYVKSMM